MSLSIREINKNYMADSFHEEFVSTFASGQQSSRQRSKTSACKEYAVHTSFNMWFVCRRGVAHREISRWAPTSCVGYGAQDK